MRKYERLNIQAILKEARSVEHREAYKTLYKNNYCRIGVIARYKSRKPAEIFLEVLVYLCPSLGKADPRFLRKSASFLEWLQRRGYSLTCQDGNCVSCEVEVPANRALAEYHAVMSLKRRAFR